MLKSARQQEEKQLGDEMKESVKPWFEAGVKQALLAIGAYGPVSKPAAAGAGTSSSTAAAGAKDKQPHTTAA